MKKFTILHQEHFRQSIKMKKLLNTTIILAIFALTYTTTSYAQIFSEKDKKRLFYINNMNGCKGQIAKYSMEKYFNAVKSGNTWTAAANSEYFKTNMCFDKSGDITSIENYQFLHGNLDTLIITYNKIQDNKYSTIKKRRGYANELHTFEIINDSTIRNITSDENNVINTEETAEFNDLGQLVTSEYIVYSDNETIQKNFTAYAYSSGYNNMTISMNSLTGDLETVHKTMLERDKMGNVVKELYTGDNGESVLLIYNYEYYK